MSDQEFPGQHSAPEPGGKGFDARDQLRRKLEEMKAAETDSSGSGDGASKVIRMPRRPRRVTEETGGRSYDPRRPDGSSVYDPAPTRPVLRSELQRETGWWPVDPGATRHPAPAIDPSSAEHDESVVDLDALRRKRAGEEAPRTGARRIARPRRIGNGKRSDTDGDRGGPDSPPPDGPSGRH